MGSKDPPKNQNMSLRQRIFEKKKEEMKQISLRDHQEWWCSRGGTTEQWRWCGGVGGMVVQP